MIGKLSGRIDYRSGGSHPLDVRGVGYIVYCSERTLMALPGNGEVISLYTDLVVREDSSAFWFLIPCGKRMASPFDVGSGRWGKSVNGHIGRAWSRRRGACHCLGGLERGQGGKGIGPKTAQRVVNELKDKAPSIMAMAPARVQPPLKPKR